MGLRVLTGLGLGLVGHTLYLFYQFSGSITFEYFFIYCNIFCTRECVSYLNTKDGILKHGVLYIISDLKDLDTSAFVMKQTYFPADIVSQTNTPRRNKGGKCILN